MAAWLESELYGGATCRVEVTAVVLFERGDLRDLVRVSWGKVSVRVRVWVRFGVEVRVRVRVRVGFGVKVKG